MAARAGSREWNTGLDGAGRAVTLLRDADGRRNMTTAITGPLTGRVALVTGASSGIGQATALALARAGASVAVGARRASRLNDLGARIRGEGGTVLATELDVTDEAACERAVARVAGEWGPVDLLVNNAGVMLLGPVVGADTSDWHRMVNTNLLGLMYLTHGVIGDMVARKAGDIVNISSIAGRTTRRLPAGAVR
jgi:NADP-dependent 3-hydroxy acid dehydrogenase YdfG